MSKKSIDLLYAFGVQHYVTIRGEGQSGRYTVSGTVHSVEREDGSGVRYNVVIANDLGTSAVFLDCENPLHKVRLG